MNRITNKDYSLMSNITMISILTIMSWPNDIKEITILYMYMNHNYSITITYNYVGLYISLILDILIWISIIYDVCFNNNIVYYLFYILNNLLFSSNDFICFSLLYEFQTIPLLFLMNCTYNVHKGIGISNILLGFYNIISGLFLYNSFYNLYCRNNIYLMNHIVFNNHIILGIIISGFIKLSIFPFHIWLGKVHVEAPTVGSILLAGVSLK